MRRVQKKKCQNQALGRSCGGFSAKIHGACDALGNPIRFILTGGDAAECTQTLALLDGMEAKAILADKGDDADYVVKAPKFIGAEVVIPSKSNRKNPRNFDKVLYRERNLIERMCNKLKHFRHVSTR